MAEKLKLFLQKNRSQLLLSLKAAIFGIFLLIASLGDFRPLPILFFIIISGIMYAMPIFGPYPTRYAFLALLISSLLGMKIVTGSVLFLPVLFGFAFIFYFLLGIKDLFFVKRSRLYSIAMLFLFYAMFVIFFLSNHSEFYILKYGSVVLASFLLFYEWLALISSFHYPKREIAAAAAGSLIIAQMLWVVTLLPFGFISASNFMLLIVFILANLLFKHFRGELSKKIIFQHIILFLVLAAFIFGGSNWTI
jgi:hypothetical protein